MSNYCPKCGLPKPMSYVGIACRCEETTATDAIILPVSKPVDEEVSEEEQEDELTASVSRAQYDWINDEADNSTESRYITKRLKSLYTITPKKPC